MKVELRSARSLPRHERAELFNASYEGYVVPFTVDEAVVAFMDDAFDIDLDASRVAFRDGVPVGLGNLGVRGEDAWIGGVGVVAGARRTGVGELLMRALHDEALSRSVRRVWLEVIDENTQAFALYEKLRYRVVRELEVWTLPAGDDAAAAPEVPLEQAQERVRALRTARDPWQRSDATVAHYADARGLATDDGAAVFRIGAAVQLVQVAGPAEPLLRTLRGHGTVSVLNLPRDDPAAAALRELGGSVTVRQHEMLLELSD